MSVRTILAAITPPTIIESEAVWRIIVVLDMRVSTILVSAQTMCEVPTSRGVVGVGLMAERAIRSRALTTQIILACGNPSRNMLPLAPRPGANAALGKEFARLKRLQFSFPVLVG